MHYLCLRRQLQVLSVTIIGIGVSSARSTILEVANDVAVSFQWLTCLGCQRCLASGEALWGTQVPCIRYIYALDSPRLCEMRTGMVISWDRSYTFDLMRDCDWDT